MIIVSSLNFLDSFTLKVGLEGALLAKASVDIQWAAVTTYFEATKVPPHVGKVLSAPTRLTIHGYLFGWMRKFNPKCMFMPVTKTKHCCSFLCFYLGPTLSMNIFILLDWLQCLPRFYWLYWSSRHHIYKLENIFSTNNNSLAKSFAKMWDLNLTEKKGFKKSIKNGFF